MTLCQIEEHGLSDCRSKCRMSEPSGWNYTVNKKRSWNIALRHSYFKRLGGANNYYRQDVVSQVGTELFKTIVPHYTFK